MDKITEKYLCNHNQISEYFCIECGSIVYENIDTMKPSRYNYLREICPIAILDNMIKESSEINFSEIRKKVDYLLLRENIIKFINYLVHKLKYRSQTFYLACYIMDLIMMIEKQDLNKELVALTSLILTVKFDEIDSVVPDLSSFLSISIGKIKLNCTIEEINQCEVDCIKILDYRLNYNTPYHFMNYFFANGIVFKDEIFKTNELEETDDVRQGHSLYEKIYYCAKEALFYFIEDEEYLFYSSLNIACACICIGRSHFLENDWDERFYFVYRIQFEDFSECYELISKIYKRRKLNSSKNSLKKKEIPASKYLSNNLPILNKNPIPKLTRLQTFGIEKADRKIQQLPKSRKNNSRAKISKYSLEPISRHLNLLESSREKKPLNENLNREKHNDNRSGKKIEKFQKILTNNNIFKVAFNEENQFKRQLSVNKQNKPFSSHLNNINIIPFIKHDNDDHSHKVKTNEDFNNFEENNMVVGRKLHLTKENFEKISNEIANSKSKNGMMEFSSNINIHNIANKINYNGNFSKNIPMINTNLEYQRIIERTNNLSSNLQKYTSSNKKRDSSKNKEITNFNSNFVPKKVVNVIPPISSLNNSNDKPFSHIETNLLHNNNIIPSKWMDNEGLPPKVNTKHIEETTNNLKEMPIPSSNLYSGKGSYSRIQSGYRDLKYRNDFNKKDEIYIPRNSTYNSHKD